MQDYHLRRPENITARAIQRATKEAALPFIILCTMIAFVLIRRRNLLILMVPFYYSIFQSAMHNEFRHILPPHYFLFIFGAMVWVIIGCNVRRAALLTSKSFSKSTLRNVES